jgi:c-di-GMP-binding flagellar brake protein YcgR
MKERRQYERFPLTLPPRMEMISSSQKRIFEFQTRDISAGGAVINTTEQFPEDTRFKFDLTVSSKKIKELTGAKSLIECEGNVVQSTSTGMAIHFDRNCRIMSLRSL